MDIASCISAFIECEKFMNPLAQRAPFFRRCKAAADEGLLPVQRSFFIEHEQKPSPDIEPEALSPQSRSRRQQVEARDCRSGKSCHRVPVRHIQRRPYRTCLASAGGRSPLELRSDLGSSVFSISHYRSFMKRVYSAIGHLPIA